MHIKIILLTLSISLIFINNTSPLCLDEINNLSDYTCVHNNPIRKENEYTVYLIKKSGKKFEMKISENGGRSVREKFVLQQLTQARYTTRLVDFYETSEKRILVESFAKKGFLIDCMTTDEYFTEKQHKFIFMQKLLQALHDLHEAGFIHGDLNPTTIGVTENNEPLLTGFGQAVYKTRISGCNGSFNYMPPEVLRICLKGDTITYDEKIDLFSWGMILYQLFHNRLPYDIKVANYVRIMFAKIMFKPGQPQDFFEIIKMVLKPRSNRSEWVEVEEKIEKVVIKPSSDVLQYKKSYFMNEYADDEEKAYKSGGKLRPLLIWGSLALILLFFLAFYFLRKKVNFGGKEEKLMSSTSQSSY